MKRLFNWLFPPKPEPTRNPEKEREISQLIDGINQDQQYIELLQAEIRRLDKIINS